MNLIHKANNPPYSHRTAFKISKSSTVTFICTSNQICAFLTKKETNKVLMLRIYNNNNSRSINNNDFLLWWTLHKYVVLFDGSLKIALSPDQLTYMVGSKPKIITWWRRKSEVEFIKEISRIWNFYIGRDFGFLLFFSWSFFSFILNIFLL